jgi:NTP pyrophosphatase (non-canonical NTP hydrolase)
MDLKELEYDYNEMVSALAKPGDDIKASLSGSNCDLIHMLLLLSGEVGELIDAYKKHLIYRKDLNREHVVEELGDIEFALARIRQIMGLNRKYVILRNMDKLRKRYTEGVYSDKEAKERKDKNINQ